MALTSSTLSLSHNRHDAMILDAANRYMEEHGFSVVPLLPNQKRPRGEWREYQTRRMTAEERQSAFYDSRPCNIGILCGAISNNLCVLDFDDIAKGREFFSEQRGVCSVMVQTRRGIHIYFQGIGISTRKIDGGDLKGEGSYVVAPPSVVAGHRYQFIKGFALGNNPLPEIPAALRQPQIHQGGRRHVRDAQRYIQSIESIQGQNGSSSLLRAIHILREARLSEAETLAAIIEWNQSGQAEPPWSLSELARAVTRAYQSPSISF